MTDVFFDFNHESVFVLSILSIAFNLIVLVVFRRMAESLTNAQIQLMSLAVSDIVVSIVNLWGFACRSTFSESEMDFHAYYVAFLFAQYLNRFITIYICHQRAMAVWSVGRAIDSTTKSQLRTVVELVMVVVATASFTILTFNLIG